MDLNLNSIHFEKYSLLIVIALFFASIIIIFGNTPTVTGFIGGGNNSDPYFVAPYYLGTNYLGRDTFITLVIAIPENTLPGSGKTVEEIKFNYYYGDSMTPTTLKVKNPSSPVLEKWINSDSFQDNRGNWWSNVSANGFSTIGGYTFTNDNYDVTTGFFYVNNKIVKMSADILVKDNITGKTKIYTTPTKTVYMFG